MLSPGEKGDEASGESFENEPTCREELYINHIACNILGRFGAIVLTALF